MLRYPLQPYEILHTLKDIQHLCHKFQVNFAHFKRHTTPLHTLKDIQHLCHKFQVNFAHFKRHTTPLS